MRHRTFLLAPIGALVAALLASPAAAARDSDSTGIDRWPAVSESTLSHMRGGLDAGALVAAFAIERLVRIDGEIVSGTRLVISGLERLASGGRPDVELIGSLAQLIRVGPGNLAVDLGGINPGAQAAPGSASGGTGTVSATGFASGSLSQFGDALSQAVQDANGAQTTPRGTVAAPAPAVTPSSAPAPALASPSIQSAGNARQMIVVSTIPDAGTLSMAIQNSVQATRIEARTSIDATLNSLSALRAADFAASLRQQAIDSIRR